MGYKILLVEDEIRMQEIIKDYFNAKGCEVICSYDGEEALDMFEENSFDLILLDVMMPKLNGFSVCKKIRTNIDNIYNKKDIPIIFITAKSDEDDNLYGYEIGADDYLTKPFSEFFPFSNCKFMCSGRIPMHNSVFPLSSTNLIHSSEILIF